MAMKEWPPFSPNTGRIALIVLLNLFTTLMSAFSGLLYFSVPFFVGLTIGVRSERRPYGNARYALGSTLLCFALWLFASGPIVLIVLPFSLAGLYGGVACGDGWRRDARR
ncbi:MAG: hypothetical protein QM756_25265 [Polyangiaceae bacterium]